LASEALAERLGQQFVVDNRPGAAGNLATGFVAAATPDGYTLVLLLSTTAVNATLYKNLSFNFLRDIVPIGMIATNPFVLVVTPLPVKTLSEFIAYGNANPGKLCMASLGVGTTPHVCGELFRMMTGIDFVHVPYSDNAMMPDLLAGRVQFYFSPTPQTITYIKDGRLRALGSTETTRLAVLPDVPAISEFVPGYEANGWVGLGAPRGTSTEAIERLNKELATIDADPKSRSKKLRFMSKGLVWSSV
jgi:tripartite-type tricarboxylate transporter receptor subunit TctC